MITISYNILLFLNNFVLKGCSNDHYKSKAEDEKCEPCPVGKTNNAMHTNCDCKEDHYIADNEDGPCYGMYLNQYGAFTSKVASSNPSSVLQCDSNPVLM